MQITPPLPVVRTLQELTTVPAIAPEIHAPRPALATSVDAAPERLAAWSSDFAAGSAPTTVRRCSDWTQSQEVARIFRRRAQTAGLDNAGAISGHSARIGSTNDLDENGATGAQIQLARGWKTDRMGTYYTLRSSVGNNAMASLRSVVRDADQQGNES
jgi:hypothetical protein